MKQIIIAYFLTFILSITTIYFITLNKVINSFLFKKSTIGTKEKSKVNYISNFADNVFYEDQFLKNCDTSVNILLLGSSELTESTDAIPYNFISKHFTTQLNAIGHAGNQCFSIYTQLLAKEQLLNTAPVVIILSPGWFESKASKGTSSKIFLEFNSERFLNKIIENENDSEVHTYLHKRIAQLYSEFNSPSIEIKLMNFKHNATKSFIHRMLYTPLIYSDNFLLCIKENITLKRKLDNTLFKIPSIVPESILINWDSLDLISKAEVIKKSTNNNMGIADEYYTEFIHGKTGYMEPVNEMFNQELEDFKMLMKLLKEKKVSASFIISPLNPLYYKNLKDILPTINIIKNEIQNNDFPYLNLLETDTSIYDKAILHDVMHMSDNGWYKVNHFIIDTYHLSK